FSGTIAVLHEALQDPDLGVRVIAAKSLWQVEGQPRLILPVLVDAIRSSRVVASNYELMNILFQIGPEGSEAIPTLREMLRDQDRQVRARAASILGLIGPDSAAFEALVEALNDSSDAVRQAAAVALGKSSSGEPVMMALIEALQDPSASVRGAAAGALG